MFEPMLLTDVFFMKCSVAELKKFFKLVKEKKLQNKIAAKACGYTPEYFSLLRKKFEKNGDKIFVHGHCGKPAYNAAAEMLSIYAVYTNISGFVTGMRAVDNDNMYLNLGLH